MVLVVAYATLFVWSFLAATLMPIGSEPALIGIVRTYQVIWVPVLIATLGNYLGACTTYWIGSRTVDYLARRREGKPPKVESRAARLLREHGELALVLSWVPILGDAIVVLAGVSKIPFAPFSFWVLTGKLTRYLVVAWIAFEI